MDTDIYLAALRAHEALPADPRCVFISGSVVRGWGNSTSDLDVYVVDDAAWTGASSGSAPVSVGSEVRLNAIHAEGCRFDLVYWMANRVDRLLDAVSWNAYDSGTLTNHTFTRYDIDLMERLSYAAALVGHDWLAERQRRLSRSAFVTHMVMQRLNMAELLTEDAVGQLQSGDQECAVLSARLAFGHAVDALLAQRGEFGQNSKWRPCRFRAVKPEALTFEEYWRIETMASYDGRQPGAWVEEVVATCRRVALAVNG